MIKCEYCKQTNDNSNEYCIYCGAPLPRVTSETISGGSGVYMVVLYDLGSCSQTAAVDLMERLFGYTASETSAMIAALPTQVAQNLSYTQAQYAAQAMQEYGMSAAVCDANGAAQTISSSQTVCNSDGSFASSALAILAGLGMANRMARFERWGRPAPAPIYMRRPKHASPRPVRPQNPGRMPQQMRRPDMNSGPGINLGGHQGGGLGSRPGSTQRPGGTMGGGLSGRPGGRSGGPGGMGGGRAPGGHGPGGPGGRR